MPHRDLIGAAEEVVIGDMHNIGGTKGPQESIVAVMCLTLLSPFRCIYLTVSLIKFADR